MSCKYWVIGFLSLAHFATSLTAQVDVSPSASANRSKLGIYRPANGSAFLLDKNGADAYIPGVTFYSPSFFLTGGFNNIASAPGDIPVSGDWNGDSRFKIGIFRPSTGQWFLDLNNNGIYDAGDLTYVFGGLAGDVPVVGDWAAIGKSCIGLVRQSYFFVLDVNCNGTYDGSGLGQDNAFAFGGLPGDVPVVGNFTGVGTRVAFVRAYAPGGVQQSPPFLWVIDNAPASDPVQTDHIAAGGSLSPFPFGGVPCTGNPLPVGCAGGDPLKTPDIYLTGDWQGTGVSHAGIYRGGSWIQDLTGAHTYDTFFQFGGLPTDLPVVGKW
jgi:hypothetical protein